MNIDSQDTPLVLLCPAWKKWGTATTVKSKTIILHSRQDDVIPFKDCCWHESWSAFITFRIPRLVRYCEIPTTRIAALRNKDLGMLERNVIQHSPAIFEMQLVPSVATRGLSVAVFATHQGDIESCLVCQYFEQQ